MASSLPIVLVPGLLCSARLYAPQIPVLWPFGPVTIADHRRDAAIGAVAKRILKTAPPRFALAGLSYGGYIAFEVLRRAPERIEKLALLEQLYEDTREQLNHEELGFALLLPDESDDFGVRLLGLASWCQGFVYGVGVSGLADGERLDDEARECLSDLLEISKLSHDEEGSDEAEMQYAEIAEHVRMVTLLLNETLNPLAPPTGPH